MSVESSPTSGLAMKLRSIFVAFLALQVCQPVIAASLYRCEVNGRVEYTDRRCQPARPICSQRDAKEPQHGQCAASAPDAGKAPVLSPAVQARSGNAADWPGRLALNEVAGGTESRRRAPDTR